MNIRRIIIATQENRRVILYPEGGLEMEQHVAGIGWVIDNDAGFVNASEDELGNLLRDAMAIVGNSAEYFAPV